jgi:glycogen synthase
VIEGAEFLAETSGISAAAPDVAMVLKLHTPSSLIGIIDNQAVTTVAKARFIIGSLRRGRRSRPYWVYDAGSDFERRNVQEAHEVTAPCRAIVDVLQDIWSMDSAIVSMIPNVFYASTDLLDIEPDTSTQTISFIGRLEYRKGVEDVAAAIPLVLEKRGDAKFRFVGRSLRHPAHGGDIAEVLKHRLRHCGSNVEFIGGVPYDEIAQFYAKTDILVAPSLWENFPNVCLEAMAAARGVIGSSAGGMGEIIEHGRTGLLVPPRDPKAIAAAILELLRDPKRRISMGRAAREHVTNAYAPEVIAPLQEASYARAIARARERLSCGQELCSNIAARIGDDST